MPSLAAAETKASPFGTTASVGKSGFNQIDDTSGVGFDGLCEHSKTTDVKIVSDILLS